MLCLKCWLCSYCSKCPSQQDAQRMEHHQSRGFSLSLHLEGPAPELSGSLAHSLLLSRILWLCFDDFSTFCLVLFLATGSGMWVFHLTLISKVNRRAASHGLKAHPICSPGKCSRTAWWFVWLGSQWSGHLTSQCGPPMSLCSLPVLTKETCLCKPRWLIPLLVHVESCCLLGQRASALSVHRLGL